ncbi:MAG TPA: hypothetical protein VNE62_00340 [Actinomycetota bacterium]|nr:hypothetical protein [Actinomycetota bacterium]
MRRTRTAAARAAAALVAVLAAAGQMSAGAAEPVKTPNVTRTASYPYVGGSEITFDGDYVYAGYINGRIYRDERGYDNQGGVLIFDVSDGEFTKVGELSCPGNDNDVMVVRPGLLAISHHRSRCNFAARGGNGIYLADVSNPRQPRVISQLAIPSAHTLTVHPTGDFIYVSPGGLANDNGWQTVVDVSDPSRPFVASRFLPSVTGCHDMSFHLTQQRQLAFCAGAGEIQTWDVSNPVNPVTIGRIMNPAIQFPHNAVVSPSGDKLVVNDEAFGIHDCTTGTSLYGSLWIYDIRVPEAPVLAGRIAPPATRSGVGNYVEYVGTWCTAHNYNFVPGTNLVVSSWFTGGTTVHDITNPLLPELVASYMPDDGLAYTAHWYRDRIYVNDKFLGMEVLSVTGVSEGTLPAAKLTGPRVDMTSRLMPPVLPDRPVRTRERKMENTLFCVITPL